MRFVTESFCVANAVCVAIFEKFIKLTVLCVKKYTSWRVRHLSLLYAGKLIFELNISKANIANSEIVSYKTAK